MYVEAEGKWMDGWMDGWTDGRTDGWMDGRTQQVSQMLCRDANASRKAAKLYSDIRLQNKRYDGYFIINYVINCIQQSFILKNTTATQLETKFPIFYLTHISLISSFCYIQCNWSDIFQTGCSVSFVVPHLTSSAEFSWRTYSV